MTPPNRHTDQELKRTKLFGGLFILVGLCFAVHGGVNLVEIYNHSRPMFELEAAFTPEKGRMWSELLAGMSVWLTGILLVIKAKMASKEQNSLE